MHIIDHNLNSTIPNKTLNVSREGEGKGQKKKSEVEYLSTKSTDLASHESPLRGTP